MRYSTRLTQQLQLNIELRWRSRFCRALPIAIVLIGLFWLSSIVPVVAATVEEGKMLFEKSCASCHSMDGSGASYGPDLQTVTQRRDRDWLLRWIAAPEKVIESGDAIAQELVQKYNGVPMPNAGLQPDLVESIVSYLENAAGTASAVPQKTETAAEIATQPVAENLVGSDSAGDAVIGQKLFAGTIPFQNGGPACMSCHTVNVIGTLRGGTLGPNLTHVIDRYTEAGLKGVLPTLPYPTMQGIYQNKLLTDSEQVRLLAFFTAANQSETGNSSSEVASFHLSSTGQFILLGVGGFLLLALLSQITWRDRLTGVRQRLVEGQKS